MSRISGKFTQAPEEKRRYILNYSLTMSAGEIVTGMNVPPVVQVFGPTTVAPLVISGIAIGASGTQVIFYCSGGDNGTQFEVQFLATTSASQIIEDVVSFDIESDL